MPDPDNPIFFPELDGTSGQTCGVYSFGFTSGCTYPDQTDRGFTQEWYYDGDVGAWVSVTETQQTYSNLNTLATPDIGSSGITYDASLTVSDSHIIQFAEATTSFETSIRFVDPPTANTFAEISLLVDNPKNPSQLNFIGLNTSGSPGVVHFDEGLDGSTFGGRTGGMTFGMHLWKVWTIDGGNNYFVYRANGYNRFWDV